MSGTTNDHDLCYFGMETITPRIDRIVVYARELLHHRDVEDVCAIKELVDLSVEAAIAVIVEDAIHNLPSLNDLIENDFLII